MCIFLFACVVAPVGHYRVTTGFLWGGRVNMDCLPVRCACGVPCVVDA